MSWGSSKMADNRPASPRLTRPVSPRGPVRLASPRSASPRPASPRAATPRSASPRYTSPPLRPHAGSSVSTGIERAHTAWDTSTEARAKPPAPRWVGRCHAKWQEEPLLLTLYAGDKIPDLINQFEAAVAQPPVEQLHRTLHMAIWRTGVGDVDQGIDLSGEEKPPSPLKPSTFAPLVIPFKGIPRSKSPPNKKSVLDISGSLRTLDLLASRKPPPAEGEPVLIRRTETNVPPVPGSRFSVHDIVTGSVESTGIFTLQLKFSARRMMTTRTVALETPLVDHPPLWFAVRPNTAAPRQSQVWVLDPQQEVVAPDGISFWDKAASVMPLGKQAAGQVAALVSSGSLASTPFAQDEQLTVAAGEKVRVRVLTRDKYLNATSRFAYKRVLAYVHSGVEPLGPEVIEDTTAPGGSLYDIEKPEQNPDAEELLAKYKGNGVHEADFVRESAGQYVASARLRGERIIGGKGQSLKLTVVPAAAHAPTCECREVQQAVVDPRSVAAALEREKIKSHDEHVRRAQGEGTTGLAVGAEETWVWSPPACMPEGSAGCFEIIAKDRFENLCDNAEVTWDVTMVAEEAWEPPEAAVPPEKRGPEYVAPTPPQPLPNGETWLEPGDDAGYYNVRFRGQAGRYLLHIIDHDTGAHCAKSPFPILIVPPAGGSRSARPHGVGARSAVADEWAHFLLRPSEFMGCEGGPCDISRNLFDQLRVTIVRKVEDRPEPELVVGEGSAAALRKARSPTPSKSPTRNRPPQQLNSKMDSKSPSSGVTLAQPPDKKAAVELSDADPPPEWRRQPEPEIVFIEKHYGSGKKQRDGRKGGGPASDSTWTLPPPPVEPGAHLVRFRVKVAGDYLIHIAYGKDALDGSPFALNVVPALLSVDHCAITGLCEGTGQITAGREVSGAVLLRDRCGNPVIPGPQVIGIPITITVDPIGPTLDPCGIEEQGIPQKLELMDIATNLGGDLHVGATFSFSLKVAGWYRVTCSVANKQLPLPHGCYPLLVTPSNKPDPQMCRLEDPPESSVPLPAGHRLGVLAVVRDRLGNVCANGGHELKATFRSPPEPIQAATATPFAVGYLPTRGLALWDKRDGTYEVIFTPQSVGQATLTVAMADGGQVAQIGGGPLEFGVEPGMPSPPHCVATGQGMRSAKAGIPAEFYVEARDAAGNLAPDRPLELRITITPSSTQQQLSVQACGDGRHLVRYVVPISGIYKLAVLVGENGSVRPIDRRHIHHSPFTVPVHSGGGGGGGAGTPRGRAVSPGSPRGPTGRAGELSARDSSPGNLRVRSASPSPRGNRGDESPRGLARSSSSMRPASPRGRASSPVPTPGTASTRPPPTPTPTLGSPALAAVRAPTFGGKWD